MPFRVTGPKGGLIVRRLKKLGRLPALVKRFGRVTITNAPAPRPDVRAGIVAYCEWGIAHEPEIHYAQTRPMPLAGRRHLPVRTDCSGFATLAYLDAGAPDPNGRGYDGSGYTGTLLQHGRHVQPWEAKPGDLVVFGPPPGDHVCVVLRAGNDPLLCSHGQEKGPLAIRFSVERRSQPRPAVFINYLD